MSAGGVSSGWRVLGSVGDIRAVREKFWHSDRYKDDLRCLKVWLEIVMFF